MSSNIRVQRICQHCGKSFEARTTVTKHCGQSCASRAYKVRLRNKKVERSQTETKAIENRPLEEIKSKEFLTVRDVAKLLSSSRQTVYSLIDAGTLKAFKLTDRKTLIRRADIDKLFQQ